MSRSARATGIVFSLFAGGVLGGAWAGAMAADHAKDPYARLSTLVRVVGLVERAYVDDRDEDAIVRAAIQGIVHDLDPHSRWMAPEEYAELQRDTEGSFTGIGVELRTDGDGAIITKVLPGSPASREGLQPGDRVLEIDGLPLDEDHPEATQALYGARGEVATLRVLREGWEHPATFTPTRDEVITPSVEVGFLEDGVGYAHLSLFQRGAAHELERALSRLSSETALRALVLDLRDNPGGLLTEAVAVADLFLDEGLIVKTWGRLPSEQAEHMATPGGLPASLPMVVLVNQWSASASEIVAAALQESGRAPLVGVATYGKGSVQTLFEHPDGSALKLTIARYYTPSGNPVAPDEGRAPDVLIPWPVSSSPRTRLLQRIAALDLDDATRAELTTLAEDVPDTTRRTRLPLAWDEPVATRASHDPQLAGALLTVRKALRRD